MLLLGLATIAWGVTVFPLFWRQSPIERTADAIVGRAEFKPRAFDALLPTLDQIEHSPECRPEALHSATIIRLRLAEDAVAAGERDVIDGRLAALDATARRSLACAPSDPFLWVTLAWIDGIRIGPKPEQLTYLRLSYQLGANEGWIAARRNRLALAMFPRLPADLSDAAVHEFARMVQSWIYLEALAIFEGPGWPIRDRLLAGLQDVGLSQREAFYIGLYTGGYNVVVPGVKSRHPRPWY